MIPDYQGLLLERLTVAYLISFQDQDDIDWKNKKHTHAHIKLSLRQCIVHDK